MALSLSPLSFTRLLVWDIFVMRAAINYLPTVSGLHRSQRPCPVPDLTLAALTGLSPVALHSPAIEPLIVAKDNYRPYYDILSPFHGHLFVT